MESEAVKANPTKMKKDLLIGISSGGEVINCSSGHIVYSGIKKVI